MTPTIKCLLCNSEEHSFCECPLMSNTQSYLNAFAPKANTPPEEPSRSSLPPTLLEQLYGEDAISALMDIADGDPELWSMDQKDLAWSLLSGGASLSKLSPQERSLLEDMTVQLSTGGKRAPRTPAPQAEREYEMPPQLLMPELDRPDGGYGDAPVVEDIWPIKG